MRPGIAGEDDCLEVRRCTRGVLWFVVLATMSSAAAISIVLGHWTSDLLFVRLEMRSLPDPAVVGLMLFRWLWLIHAVNCCLTLAWQSLGPWRVSACAASCYLIASLLASVSWMALPLFHPLATAFVLSLR